VPPVRRAVSNTVNTRGECRHVYDRPTVTSPMYQPDCQTACGKLHTISAEWAGRQGDHLVVLMRIASCFTLYHSSKCHHFRESVVTTQIRVTKVMPQATPPAVAAGMSPLHSMSRPPEFTHYAKYGGMEERTEYRLFASGNLRIFH